MGHCGSCSLDPVATASPPNLARGQSYLKMVVAQWKHYYADANLEKGVVVPGVYRALGRQKSRPDCHIIKVFSTCMVFEPLGGWCRNSTTERGMSEARITDLGHHTNKSGHYPSGHEAPRRL